MKDKLINKEIIYTGEYFNIEEQTYENRKTCILVIYTKDNFELGQIKWYGAWRKYCFYPNSNTIWDNKCLIEVLDFIKEYTDYYKNNKKRGK